MRYKWYYTGSHNIRVMKTLCNVPGNYVDAITNKTPIFVIQN